MSERKVQNKYVSKYFNHEKLVKLRKPIEKQHNVRMMLPFSIKCDTCGNYFKIGTKTNMRKETCRDEDYLGIEIYRLYMKCITCYSEISMKTDPKNHDYTLEHGAVRLYESWKDARASEILLKEIRERDEEGNNMKLLEYKTYDSKKEMDAIEAIDEIRSISKKNAKFDLDKVIEEINKKDDILKGNNYEKFYNQAKDSDLKNFLPDNKRFVVDNNFLDGINKKKNFKGGLITNKSSLKVFKKDDFLRPRLKFKKKIRKIK